MTTFIRRGMDMADAKFQTRSGIDIHVRCVSSSTQNFSLAGLYSKEAVEEKADLCQNLVLNLSDMGAKHVYAPTPIDFNAKVIPTAVLSTVFSLGGGITMYRNEEKDALADGTFLQSRGDAGIFSVAGCPMLVMTYRDYVAFLHAGFRCLVDFKWIDTRIERRPNESVIDSAFQAFEEKCAADGTIFQRDDVEARAFWAIPPKDFNFDLNHKEERFRKFNPKMREYVLERFSEEAIEELGDGKFGVDLPVIIREQFGKRGINVNLDDAYLPSGFHTTRNSDGMRCLMAAVRTS